MACITPTFEDITDCPSATEALPGFGGIASIALVDDLDSEPTVPALTDALADDAYATATGNFVFKSGKKFIKASIVSDFTEANGESIGSTGNLGAKFMPKIRVKNTAATSGWLKKNVNRAMTLVLEKPGGVKKRYGSIKFPVRIEKWNVADSATDNYLELQFTAQPLYMEYLGPAVVLPYTPAIATP